MADPFDAVLDCPVCEGGRVRLFLVCVPGGEIPLWLCSACNSEWHEDGKPRWSIELAVDVEFDEASHSVGTPTLDGVPTPGVG